MTLPGGTNLALIAVRDGTEPLLQRLQPMSKHTVTYMAFVNDRWR